MKIEKKSIRQKLAQGKAHEVLASYIDHPTTALKKILFHLLKDNKPEATASAAWIIGEAGIEDTGERLLPLLNHANPLVREMATLSITKIEYKEALQALGERLEKETDPFVKRKIREALSYLTGLWAQKAHLKYVVKPKPEQSERLFKQLIVRGYVTCLDPRGEEIRDRHQIIKLLRGVQIIVSIPSYQEGRDVAIPAEQAFLGLKQYFSKNHICLLANFSHVVLNNTKRDFIRTVEKLSQQQEENIYYLHVSTGLSEEKAIVTGKGNNLRILFEIVNIADEEFLGGAVVDADLKSITPEWVLGLISPILDDNLRADYVVPWYSRNRYDGTITNNIVMPLVAILGYRVRQPIAGDFGFSRKAVLGSGKKAKGWLGREWLPSTFRYGIDNFMTTSVILDGLTIVESVLGAKIHDPSAPKLSQMFIEVVETLFNTVIENKAFWVRKRGLKSVPRTRVRKIRVEPPQSLTVDEKKLKETFLSAFQKGRIVEDIRGEDRLKSLRGLLRREAYQRIEEMVKQKTCRIGNELWADIVFDFLSAYYRSKTQRKKDVLIGTLMFLYFGRVTSFVHKIEKNVKIFRAAWKVKHNLRQVSKKAETAIQNRAHKLAEETTLSLAALFAQRRSELASLLEG